MRTQSLNAVSGLLNTAIRKSTSYPGSLIRVASFLRQETLKIAFGINDFEKLNRLGNQFAVISAYRPWSKNKNKKTNVTLATELQNMGYRKFVKQKSSWLDDASGEETQEGSYLVPNMTFQDAIALMQHFGQDAIIFKDISQTVGIYHKDHNAAMSYDVATGDPVVLSEITKGGYSKSRSMSFSLVPLFDEKFNWINGPITKKKTLTLASKPACSSRGKARIPGFFLFL